MFTIESRKSLFIVMYIIIMYLLPMIIAISVISRMRACVYVYIYISVWVCVLSSRKVGDQTKG